mgnify:FL=1
MAIKGFFITGTDTDVGKTLVAGAVALQLRSQYSRVAAYKPVVAGLSLSDGKWQNDDLLALAQACSFDISMNEMCPYQLRTPAAPHLVAHQENIEISYQKMLFAYQELAARSDAIVVEGVGGFLVPLDLKKDSGDFAKDIQLPVILVVGMKLGCINHALLTAEAILQRGLTLKGWVANIGPSPMNLLEENIHTLQQLLPSPLLGVIPSLPTNLSKTPYSREAMELVSRHLALT